MCLRPPESRPRDTTPENVANFFGLRCSQAHESCSRANVLLEERDTTAENIASFFGRESTNSEYRQLSQQHSCHDESVIPESAAAVSDYKPSQQQFRAIDTVHSGATESAGLSPSDSLISASFVTRVGDSVVSGQIDEPGTPHGQSKEVTRGQVEEAGECPGTPRRARKRLVRMETHEAASPKKLQEPGFDSAALRPRELCLASMYVRQEKPLSPGGFCREDGSASVWTAASKSAQEASSPLPKKRLREGGGRLEPRSVVDLTVSSPGSPNDQRAAPASDSEDDIPLASLVKRTSGSSA